MSEARKNTVLRGCVGARRCVGDTSTLKDGIRAEHSGVARAERGADPPHPAVFSKEGRVITRR